MKVKPPRHLVEGDAHLAVLREVGAGVLGRGLEGDRGVGILVDLEVVGLDQFLAVLVEKRAQRKKP